MGCSRDLETAVKGHATYLPKSHAGGGDGIIYLMLYQLASVLNNSILP